MRTVLPALFLAGMLVFPLPAQAQQAAPLQKSDLIRLLSGATYTKAEVAAIVRQSCLTFTPSQRDRTDLRALGADAEVMQAIDDCRSSASSVEVAVSASRLTAQAGTHVRLIATLVRGGAPLANARVQLVGSGRIRGGIGADLSGRTDSGGQVTFMVPAGRLATTYRFTLAVTGQAVTDPPTVVLQTRAGAAGQMQATPTALESDADVARRTTSIRATDLFGNPVAGAEIEVRSGEDANDRLVASGETDAAGELSVTVALADMAGASSFGVFAADRLLGTIGIGQGGASEAGTRFVSGTDQTADAGASLPQRLVLRVQDASGTPLAGQEVRFSATNGRVSPETTQTDENGRATTRVTLGTSAGATQVVAIVGAVRKQTTFEATIGGLRLAEIQAIFAAAEELLEAGDARGAREAYERVLEADPNSVQAGVGLGRTHIALGDQATAISVFQGVLREHPTAGAAQRELAEALLASGQAEEAVRWYEVVVRRTPADADVWVGLGRARAASGRTETARTAFETALRLDPEREDARRGLSTLVAGPVVAEITAWAGTTEDNGRDPGIRNFELRLRPPGRVSVWGGYKNGLDLRHPYRTRGRDDIEEGYGGFSVDLGATRWARTSIEIASRSHPTGLEIDGETLSETVINLEQQFFFRNGSYLALGGEFGNFEGTSFGKGDNVFFVKAGLLASPGLIVTPGVSVAHNFGSNIVGKNDAFVGLLLEKEVRGSLGVEYTSPKGWGVAPTVAYGNVYQSEELAALEGGLFDGRVRLWIPLGRYSRVNLLVLYQSPPGTDSFTTIALGFTVGVRRSP